MGGVQSDGFLLALRGFSTFTFLSRKHESLDRCKHTLNISPSFAATMATSADNEDYELVQARERHSSPGSLTDDTFTRPIPRLPPKLLPPRSARAFTRSVFVPTCIAVFLLSALSVLISQLRLFQPDLSEPKLWGDGTLPFPISGYTVPRSGISCDLVSKNASLFEKIFVIDLRSQSQLSFAQAKLIDVVWDLLIGQGGRLLLGWISYIVFMDGLARLMERSAVSYTLYESIVFNTSSMTATWRALKAVSTNHGWRGRAFLGWFGLATTYVLGYSTLMSAATGYIAPSDARYPMPGGSLVASDSEDIKHCLLLHNGSAVNLPDDYLVPGPSDQELARYRQSPYDEFRSSFELFHSLTSGKFSIEPCLISINTLD